MSERACESPSRLCACGCGLPIHDGPPKLPPGPAHARRELERRARVQFRCGHSHHKAELARRRAVDPPKLCACGCGTPLTTAHYTGQLSPGERQGYIARLRYVVGHSHRRERANFWRGGERVVKGIHLVLAREYPNVNSGGYANKNLLRVVAARGGAPLPKGTYVFGVSTVPGVHHRDSPDLVVGKMGYMNVLRRRARALIACGHADYYACPECREYDHPRNMVPHTGGRFIHLTCRQEANRERWQRRAARSQRPVNHRKRGSLYRQGRSA